MKVHTYSTEEAWMEGRRGRIGGSRAGSMFSKRDKKPLKAFYEVIAERVAIPASNENALDRGNRLEEEAVERFNEETGRKAVRSRVIWTRDDSDYISSSPDATFEDDLTAAVEVKCLNSAAHIEAWLTKEIPKEYDEQAVQYFVVNDKLERLYFCFYDPRMPKDFFFIEVNRADVESEIAEQLALQQQALAQIEDIVNKLTF